MELGVNHVAVSRPGEDALIQTESRSSWVKLLRDELLVIEARYAPGESGAAPHIHREHADGFYVLEGELGFQLADEKVTLEAGSFGLAPPGLVHAFTPGGAGETRFLNFHAPGHAYVNSVLSRRDGRSVSREETDTFDPPADGGLPRAEGTLLRAGEGESAGAEGRDIFIKADRPELSMFEFHIGPSFKGPGPHLHKQHVDCFYVLEGELEFGLDTGTVHAAPGTLVAAPPDAVHWFTNSSGAHARFLNVHAPDPGFVDYVRARARGDDVDPTQFDMFDVD